MIKNITAYRFQCLDLQNTASTAKSLVAAKFVACGQTQAVSVGWSSPRGGDFDQLFERIGDDCVLLRFTSEAKVLPASVISRAAAVKIKELEERLGRKISRDERYAIRDEITLDMMVKAFTKIAHTSILINEKTGLLIVDTISATRSDEVVALLLRTFSGLELTPLVMDVSPSIRMGAWLLAKEAPGKFDIDDYCELAATDDSGGVVRYKNHSLAGDDLVKHLRDGMRPAALGMTWDGRISFVLTGEMRVRRIKFLEGVFETAGEEVKDRFDGDWAIISGEVGRMLPDLISLFEVDHD